MKKEVSAYVNWIGNLEVLPDGRLLGMFTAQWWVQEPYGYPETGAVPKSLEATGEGCFIADVSGEQEHYEVGLGISDFYREWSDILGVEMDFEHLSWGLVLALEHNPENGIERDICRVYRKWKEIQVNKLIEQEKIERGVQQALRPRVVETMRNERF